MHSGRLGATGLVDLLMTGLVERLTGGGKPKARPVWGVVTGREISGLRGGSTGADLVTSVVDLRAGRGGRASYSSSSGSGSDSGSGEGSSSEEGASDDTALGLFLEVSDSRFR